MRDLLYLLIGTDNYLLDLKLSEMLKDEHVDLDEVIKYDMEEHSLDDLLQEVTTVPFFTEQKIVIAKNSVFLTDAKSNSEASLEALVRYCEKPSPSTVLIFQAPYQKLDQTKPIVKTLKKYAYLVEVDVKKPIDYTTWVKEQFTDANIQIDQAALDELIARTQEDFQALTHETEKLLLYAMNHGHVFKKTVDYVVTRHLEDNVFDLTNALLAGQKTVILTIYYDLMEKNEDPLRIMNTIVSKFREMMHTKLLIEKGMKQQDIANYFNVKSGRAYYMMKNANQASFQQIESEINRLANLDFEIKSGQIDKKIGLELYLLSA